VPKLTEKNDPPRLQLSRQVVARGGMCNFTTMEGCLYGILDLLVNALHEQLAGKLQWLVILYTSCLHQEQRSSHIQHCVGNKSSTAHTPHPPAEPPRSRGRGNAGSRPPLTRRVLQNFSGSSFFRREAPTETAKIAFLSDEATTSNFDSIVQTNRSISAPPIGRERGVEKTSHGNEVPAQGKLSWWFSRRSKSQNATSRSKSLPDDSSGAVNEISPMCFYYHQEKPEDDDAPRDVAYLSACMCRSSSKACASATSSAWIDTFELPVVYSESHAPARRVDVVMFSISTADGKMTVGMPAYVLQSEVSKDRSHASLRLEDVVSARRALDLELTAMSEHIRFLHSTHKRVLSAEAQSIRPLAGAKATQW